MTQGEPTQSVFAIRELADVVAARRSGLEAALALGFHQAEATKIAVVISELARNIERYAGTGTITLIVQAGPDGYVKIVAEDHGPGIPDVARVLAGGYTTSKGLGLGLSGSKRLMDEFDIQSTVGMGTRVTAVKWLQNKRW